MATSGILLPRVLVRPALGGLLLSLAINVHGAPDLPPQSMLDLSLEQLMEIEIDTASKRPSSWREQPGVITVFSADDMVAMGAKTLLDVVQRIPGTSLGIDGRNSIGLMMRGNWTLEGKILVLLNDMPLNELLYGSWSPLPYIPVGQLDRVEVLRGPGSTQYGGSAQLAVIRIFTRQPGGANDGQIDYTAIGQSGEFTQMVGLSQRFASGQWQGALNLSGNRGVWGNETWIDNTGAAISTAEADTNGSTLALSVNRANRDHLQLYHEQFDIDAIQGFGTAEPQGVVLVNRTRLRYAHDLQATPALLLSPHLSYSHDNLRVQAPEEPTVFDVTSRSMGAALDLQWEYDSRNQLSAGFEYSIEGAKANTTTGPFFPAPTALYFGDSDEVDYERSSVYGDWNLALGDYVLTLGARASHHQDAGNAVTPRAGLTRAGANWHFKWLYGEAFREPNIETIHYGTRTESISPERTVVHEFELGHRLLANGYLTLSVFDQRIDDAIIFNQDQIDEFTYYNHPTMHTYGTELQYLYRTSGFSLQANYSWTRSNDDDLAVYDVPQHAGQYIGAPAQVGNLWLTVATPVPHLSSMLGLRYVGSRHALDFDPALAQSQPGFPLGMQRLDAEFTVNAALRYQISPATLTLGVDNLFDEEQQMPQPYSGFSTPFPYGSRGIWLRGEWEWD